MTQTDLPHSSLFAKPLVRCAAAGLIIGLGAAGVYWLIERGGSGAASSAAVATVPPTRDVSKLDAVLNTIVTAKGDGEFGTAETILREAVKTYPGEPRLYIEYAETLAALKRPEEAYAMYERAIASGEDTGEVHFAAGTVASTSGKLERAVEHFSAAQAKSPQDWKASLFLAQVQVRLDRFDEAKKNLLIAVQLKPDLGIAWGTLAELALRENKTKMALQHVAKARELEPDVTLWRVIQGRALVRDAKPEEALLLLTGLSEVEQREPGVMQLMSQAYGLLKRPLDAAALYVNAAKTDTARGDLAFEAAQWFERAGETEKAREWAERAKLLGDPNAAALLERLSK
jgi:predicted Zn-dependent protease